MGDRKVGIFALQLACERVAVEHRTSAIVSAFHPLAFRQWTPPLNHRLDGDVRPRGRKERGEERLDMPAAGLSNRGLQTPQVVAHRVAPAPQFHAAGTSNPAQPGRRRRSQSCRPAQRRAPCPFTRV